LSVIHLDSGDQPHRGADSASQKEHIVDGNLVGLVAVIMVFGIPIAAMYTFYHVRKLRTEERLAAIARGANVPMQPELPEAARSRRSGILLVTGALGYMLTFALIARMEPDAWVAAAFGLIPLSVGIGFFVDSALIRRDLHA
jgi:cadmium resistance protein CadD (predicted permease)